MANSTKPCTLIKFEIKWEAPIEAYMSGSFPDTAAAMKRMGDLIMAFEHHLAESGMVNVSIKLTSISP